MASDEASVQIVDPFAVVAKLDQFAGMALWPDFDPSSYPIAIYDGEHTFLLRHPSPPAEFTPSKVSEGVWETDGRHAAMRWNSNADLAGIRVATLLLTIQPGREVDLEASFLLHEVFHLYSKPRHPTWNPDEMDRYGYPLEDLENSSLLLLEEEALARALEAENESLAASWAALAMHWRQQRRQGLTEEILTYETALEMQEGTAVYLSRLALGRARDTTRLREIRTPEELRWRFYDTGAALAAMLDRLEPRWKSRLEAEPEITMDELLAEALVSRRTAPARLPAPETALIRARAEEAVTQLKVRRRKLREEFLARGPRLVVIASGSTEPLSVQAFDPLALEILEGGEALQAHRLMLETSSGQIEVDNPRFQRGSFQGVVSLTVPAGPHPFLDGVMRVTVSGFPDAPKVNREGQAVRIEAEGVRLKFRNVVVLEAGEEIQVQLQGSSPHF
jgi:hypothetical protein